MATRGIEAYVRSLAELRSEFRGRIMKAVQAIVDFEVSALEEAADRLDDFDEWLNRFYPEQYNLGSGERFIDVVAHYIGPVVREFMQRVQWPAVHTLFGEEPPAWMLDDFIERYVRDYALRHGSSSKRQTLEVMEKAEAEAKAEAGAKTESSRARKRLPPEEITRREAANMRWREWKDGRAGTTADNEVVREGNAASREAWEQSGVTKLKWRTRGKNCPFCNKLDGKVVGIDRPFMEDGEVMTVKLKEIPSKAPGWKTMDEAKEGASKLISGNVSGDRLDTLNSAGEELTRLKSGPFDMRTDIKGLDMRDPASWMGNEWSGSYDPRTEIVDLSNKQALKHELTIGNAWSVGADLPSSLRHELGHHNFYKSAGKFQSGWSKVWKELKQTEGFSWEATVSKYAASHRREAFAECFGAYTSPLYSGSANKLPKAVEDFFERVLAK